MKNERKAQANVEICRLRKSFEALTIDHQKGVLKTALGLLRIQRAHKTMVADNTLLNFSLGKNG
jgi:hypothetical protein